MSRFHSYGYGLSEAWVAEAATGAQSPFKLLVFSRKFIRPHNNRHKKARTWSLCARPASCVNGVTTRIPPENSRSTAPVRPRSHHGARQNCLAGSAGLVSVALRIELKRRTSALDRDQRCDDIASTSVFLWPGLRAFA